MKTQFDWNKRVVSLENLKAMCQRVSGTMCHQFWVESVSRSRCKIGYSNENEYASEFPIYVVFPVYPSGSRKEDLENPCIILDPIRVIHNPGNDWHGEEYQAFECLFDCPTLWRDPVTQEWSTEEELRKIKP